MRKSVAVAVAVAALAGSATSANAAPTAHAATCFEDQPCWNWVTMGNGQRGVTTVTGRNLVVGTCRFRKLWRAKKIRYHGAPYVIERIKGDGFARRHGCEQV
jgi:hypothetical protein